MALSEKYICTNTNGFVPTLADSVQAADEGDEDANGEEGKDKEVGIQTDEQSKKHQLEKQTKPSPYAALTVRCGTSRNITHIHKHTGIYNNSLMWNFALMASTLK